MRSVKVAFDIESLFFVAGYHPHKIHTEKTSFWMLRWTIFHILLNIFIALYIAIHNKLILSQQNRLGNVTDVGKLLLFFFYIFATYIEVLWKLKNHSLLDKTTSEIESLLENSGLDLLRMKIKIKRRALALFISFFPIYLICKANVLFESLTNPQGFRFVSLTIFPQVLKYIKQFHVLYHITKILIYVESINKELIKTPSSLRTLYNLTKCHQKCEKLMKLFIQTFNFSFICYVFQEGFQILSDFYWLISIMFVGGKASFWTLTIAKACFMFQIFYNGQLCANLVRF